MKPVKNITQIESMDNELRTGLWNAFFFSYHLDFRSLELSADAGLYSLLHAFWKDFFKWPLDTLPQWRQEAVDIAKSKFFNSSWNEAYDFIEFVARHSWTGVAEAPILFAQMCNDTMEQEVAGYRLIGGEIVPITSQAEIEEIEEALGTSDKFKPVTVHLANALDKLADRQTPDYRNSIKESISAVESMCRLITGSTASGLDGALKEVEKRHPLHGALTSAFRSLYGYSSDAEGIRHALLEESNLRFEDAKFMLVACSAFVNYLQAKT